MVDQQALLTAMADYAHVLLRDHDAERVYHRVAEHIVAVLGVDGASVSVVDGGGLRVASATDAGIGAIEATQLDEGEGPGHEAYHTGRVITSHDLADDERWSRYRKVAVDQGWRSVAGIPMAAGSTCIGAVNAYARQARAWSADALEVASVLARLATACVANATTLADARRLSAQLEHALDSRVVIEQAKGRLAERHAVTVDEAFDRLRTHARSNHVRLHDVARGVVTGRAHL